MQTDHQISNRTSDLMIVNNKKNCRIVEFAVPANHRVKLKEGEKKDKYLDLARELKRLRNMKVTVIPIVIGVLSTVIKGLGPRLGDLEIRGWVETTQTTALLRSVRLLRRLEETCCHSASGERPSAKTGGKNSQEVKSTYVFKIYEHFYFSLLFRENSSSLVLSNSTF